MKTPPAANDMKPPPRSAWRPLLLGVALALFGLFVAVLGVARLVPCGVVGRLSTSVHGIYHHHNAPYPAYTLEIGALGTFQLRWWGCATTYLWGTADPGGGYTLGDEGLVELRSWAPLILLGGGEPTRYRLIEWEPRLYLVPEGAPEGGFAAMCNAVNAGLEPRKHAGAYRSEAYLRTGDWERPATGSPHLPERWALRLRATPLTGTVTSARGCRSSVDVGTHPGAWVGMVLYRTDKQDLFWNDGRVVSVSARECVVEIHREGELPAGAKVSTQPPPPRK